jgi:hypothetical protein
MKPAHDFCTQQNNQRIDDEQKQAKRHNRDGQSE